MLCYISLLRMLLSHVKCTFVLLTEMAILKHLWLLVDGTLVQHSKYLVKIMQIFIIIDLFIRLVDPASVLL